VVVGVGANLGDRLATMRDGVDRLARSRGLGVVARSRVYETAPVGGPPQPPFLNAAILVESVVSPLSLLDALLRIEGELGRVRQGERFGPRTLDLDVLWADGLVVDEPRLVVPHPRLIGRAFALVPMLELVPGARDPRTRLAYISPEDAGVRLTQSRL
jgi:2-amino-4-hydroxy-6-hydroxymethyldihydropteridine diphosphokinase